MHLYCTGNGAPTVVLDSGLGGSFIDWSRVQPAVGIYTRVCSYDRSGYGYSQSGARPRTSSTIAQELHALLDEAGVDGPYVMVGHSFGGFNVRMFASLYPERVAALVLVDSSQAGQLEKFEAGNGPSTAPRGRFMVFSPAQLPPNLPPALLPMANALTYRPLTNRTVYAELKWFRKSAQEVRLSPDLPTVPMIVISRGQREWTNSKYAQRMEAVWQQLQRAFVARYPGTIHLVAEHSGHYVPLEQPRIVAGGICMAVQSVRAGKHWRRLPAGWLRQRCLPARAAARSAWQ